MVLNACMMLHSLACPKRRFSGNCLSKRQVGRVLAKSLIVMSMHNLLTCCNEMFSVNLVIYVHNIFLTSHRFSPTSNRVLILIPFFFALVICHRWAYFAGSFLSVIQVC